MQSVGLPPISDEFMEAELGDARRVARLCKLSEAMAIAPDGSLPRQADDDAELEATYRFLGNPDVSPEAVLQAHVRKTQKRAAEHNHVLVLHDTTKFSFSGTKKREGLGRITCDRQQGFLAHASLCVSPAGEPLGLVELMAWTRGSARKGRTSQYDPDRESLRWHELAHSVEELLHGHTQVIHVMDREGDAYELLADLLEHDARFVVRVCHNRRLDKDKRSQGSPMLFDTLAAAPARFDREVILGKRKRAFSAKKRKVFPSRESRTTRLEARAQRIEIAIGNGAPAHLPPTLELNFVDVRETEPPEGASPVVWRLVTTEPIDTPEEVAAIVDTYRQRWLIEEYFKAIKTGCAYEELQLESAHGLLTALAVYSVVAWRILLLRWLCRAEPEAPAERALSQTQLDVLKAERAQAGRPLPEKPTVQDALYAVASLGGHHRRREPPGWQTLKHGYERLLRLEAGWVLALTVTGAMTRCVER